MRMLAASVRLHGASVDAVQQLLTDPLRAQLRELLALLRRITRIRALGFYSAKDGTGRTFVVFVLQICIINDSWKVYRRYSQFLELERELQAQLDVPFPSRALPLFVGRAEAQNVRCGELFAWLENGAKAWVPRVARHCAALTPRAPRQRCEQSSNSVPRLLATCTTRPTAR